MFAVLWGEKKKFNELIYAFQTSRNLKRDYWNLRNLWVGNAQVIQFVDKGEKMHRETGSMGISNFVCY